MPADVVGAICSCAGPARWSRATRWSAGLHVDVSRLTGEPMPAAAARLALRSGSLNLEGAPRPGCAPAGESQYARIVELVRSAQASKSPMQRLADRYAVWFTPLTLVVCAGAWLGSGDPVRVLAVSVVATPCPLILATPVAIIGGINRAARRGIIFRHGTALEQLGRSAGGLRQDRHPHDRAAGGRQAPAVERADEMLRLSPGSSMARATCSRGWWSRRRARESAGRGARRDRGAGPGRPGIVEGGVAVGGGT